MIRVNLNPRKKGTAAATIGVVSAGLLVACGIMVGWFGGAASFTSRPTIGEYYTGYKPNLVEQEKFIGGLGRLKSLRTGAPDLFTEALPKDALLWKFMYAASEKSGRGQYRIINQEIGDCVSHAYARAVECALAVEYMQGSATDWWPVSPESVYAGRIDTGDASWSDGWYGSSASKAVRDYGVLFKRKYEGEGSGLDLTVYSGQRAKQMGARGLPKWIYAERKKHLVKEVALITSVAEAKAALANGYPIAICSNVGFEPVPTRRDQNGVATASGSWSHAKCICGYYTIQGRRGEETIYVDFNSWGPNASTGPGGPHDIPGGAFGITEQTMQRILSQRDSYAVSGPRGFERRDLDHETWGNWSKESEEHFAVAP